MPLYPHIIDVFPDTGPNLQDWECDFDCTHERADKGAGFAGGWECEFFRGRIGALEITRDMLIQIAGKSTVDAIETSVTEAMTAEHWRVA